MQQVEDGGLQAFTTYYGRKEQDSIREVKQKLEKQQNCSINYECFFKHKDVKILYGLLFFALTPPEKYDNTEKRKKILNKMGYNQMTNAQKQKLNSLYLQWDNKKSLVNVFWKNQNRLSTNKGLIKKLTVKVSEKQCFQLVRLSLNQIKPAVHVQYQIDGYGTMFQKKNQQNWITVFACKEDKSYILAIHSNKQQLIKHDSQIKHQKITTSQIRNSSQSNDSKQANQHFEPQAQRVVKKNKLTEKSKSAQIVTDTQTSTTKLQKSKSQGDILSNNKFDPYEVTWFEIIVVLIIIAVLLSEFAHIFDPFLKTFNKDVGNYYFLEGGYKLNNFIFSKSHNQSL